VSLSLPVFSALQQQDYGAVRPLTLLLRAMLKQRSLAEVFRGGLGSWSLVNMVIAHLMVSVAGMTLPLLDPPASCDGALCGVAAGTCRTVASTRSSAHAAPWSP
jgi:hypothetical protein